MSSIVDIMFEWKPCFKFNFIVNFATLANIATFLYHTKENADVSKICV